MKLIDKTTLENITFYVLVFSLLILGIITFASTFSCTSGSAIFILCIISVVLIILAVATGCEGVFRERKLLVKAFTCCGIVTTKSIFSKLKVTDIIHFYRCCYNGKSDIPEIKAEQTWVIKAKGKHYIQIYCIEQDKTWDLLPRDFYKLFDEIPIHYNKILVNDQVIHNTLK